MRNRLASVAVCAAVVIAGVVGAIQAAPAPQGPAPAAPKDTAALRAQYEKWRTEFKTWGKWAPVGQESRGDDVAESQRRVGNRLVLNERLQVSLAIGRLRVRAIEPV